jgi:hypothetical protein
MAAPDPFNSAGGYSVGIPPLPIVAANGDVTAGNISGDNLNVTSTIRAGGDVYGNTFYGKFAGSISGGLTVPGLTTQILFNTNGNADASQNLTFNASTNVLKVDNGSVTANAFTLGTGVNQFSTTQSLRVNTNVTTPDQILTTIQANTVCGIDYTIIATDPIANNRQTSKIMATILNGDVGYYEYGTIDVPQSSPGVADFKVAYTGGNVNLTVTPYTNSVNYKIMITNYKE